MGKQSKTEEPGPAVRIHPKMSSHDRIERLQAFFEFTEGPRPTKEEVCLRAIEKGLPELEQQMKDYVLA